MDAPDVNSDSLQAVKSLRSKFEQLASSSPSTATPIQQRSSSYSGQQVDSLAVEPLSPRPRASSNTLLHSPTTDMHMLRPSSSSSDLKKRPPPPPPPPRGLKPPSRTPSPVPPLLRPVPVPPSSVNAPSHAPSPGPRPVSSNTLVDITVSVEPEAPTVHQSVASLKSRFSSSSPPVPARVSSPRPISATSLQNEYHASYTGAPSSKPAVPPRPPKSIEGVPVPLISHQVVRSPDQLSRHSPSSSLSSSLRSPSIGDDDMAPNSYDPPLLPPPIPARINNNQVGIRSLGTQFSDSSRDSIPNEPSSMVPPRAPARLAMPPPPPRHRSSLSPAIVETVSAMPSSSSSPSPSNFNSNPNSNQPKPPPPLPFRRGAVAVAQPDETPSSRLRGKPTLALGPPITALDSLQTQSATASPSIERRHLGTSKLPPPPTRTIALGDKLPPARRPSEPSSDEDSAAEEDDPRLSGAAAADLMPDSSTSSRRPPHLSYRAPHPAPKIYVHPHSGLIAPSGAHIAVAHGHHLKIYDLAQAQPDAPVWALDTKDLGARDAKITSLEYRPCAEGGKRGFLLWVGMKEGHIVEVDIRTGVVGAVRMAAHLYPVTHIFRHGNAMVSLDESGKTLVFAPAEGGEISLVHTTPRVARTTEKQDFAKMLAGKLWTAARSEHHGTTTSQKLPIIRVFDVFNPANTGRSLLPTEHVGAVTSGTILPSHADFVFLGHEEGFISIWALDTDDGYPKCVEVMKVSMSDVLCLEGVNDRLWAGGRNGMISAYDVRQRPWMVTNCWNAHPGLPVSRLAVNYLGIEKTQRLCVVSVGRDEQLRLWDGLLGLDWVDKELLKSEKSFSTFRELSVLVVSWNCDSARPDSLTGDPANVNFLNNVLHSTDSPPDVIAFGFQEVIDLESRKMTAKNVLLGSKKKEDMGLSDKVTGAYKRWYDRLVTAVRVAMPPDMQYSVVHTESLVGLFSCIFVKNTERTLLDDVAVTTIKRGMGGRYGNKGGIVARFVIGDSSICLINCHLAAGQAAVRRRNADAAGILEEKAVFPVADHQLAYVGGGDGTMVLDHEIVFFHGDMNYRIDHRRDAIIAAVRAGDYASLINYDQLIREIKHNRGCRLRGFSEGPLTFAPTYKYDPRSTEYDTSEKHRAPAWCDRILWRTRDAPRVRQLHYRRYEANVSDHRPISAAFTITVKSLQMEAREEVKAVVESTWIDEQERLLEAAREFYVSQALL